MIGSQHIAQALVLYTSPSRYYHNIDHVAFMLRMLDVEPFASLVQNRPAMQAAIVFHDAIYDVDRQDNEEQSARMADRYLEDIGAHSSIRRIVWDLIMATTHKSREDLTPDQATIQDLDLLGFAIDGQTNAEKIRDEYANVPDSVYYPNRLKVLEWFASRDPFYNNVEVEDAWGDAARENIAYEISDVKFELLPEDHPDKIPF